MGGNTVNTGSIFTNLLYAEAGGGVALTGETDLRARGTVGFGWAGIVRGEPDVLRFRYDQAAGARVIYDPTNGVQLGAGWGPVLNTYDIIKFPVIVVPSLGPRFRLQDKSVDLGASLAVGGPLPIPLPDNLAIVSLTVEAGIDNAVRTFGGNSPSWYTTLMLGFPLAAL